MCGSKRGEINAKDRLKNRRQPWGLCQEGLLIRHLHEPENQDFPILKNGKEKITAPDLLWLRLVGRKDESLCISLVYNSYFLILHSALS